MYATQHLLRGENEEEPPRYKEAGMRAGPGRPLVDMQRCGCRRAAPVLGDRYQQPQLVPAGAFHELVC
ncbi:MAG: hypothetical protein CL878_13070 [Dehalococcoidia bacterium]|nr:hypothetical protein [Dehalococcoidia bacterium]